MMDDDIRMALLDAIAGGALSNRSGKSKKRPRAQQVEMLREAYDLWTAPRVKFKPGDLIQAKCESLSAWRTTSNGQVLMVMEVLDEPRAVKDQDAAASQYAHMVYDIIAMSVTESDNTPQHYYDSRYFKLYDKAAEEEDSSIVKFRRS